MKLETREASLGKIHPCRVEDTLAVSPDGKRVAYWANCIAESLGNKPTQFATEQIDYVRSVGGWSQVLGVWRLVVDGVEHGEYGRILGRPPVFSPDSKRVAYVAVRGEQMFVVVNGQEGREYDGIAEGGPIFSPDSKRVAYVAKRQGKIFVVVDGIEGKEYTGIMKGTPIFSPDSKRVAYAATPVGRDRIVAVVDGEEGEEYDFILNHNLLFSPDSQRIAYMAAHAPGEWMVVVDAEQGKQYETIVPGSLVFSPDSKRFAYVVERRGKLVGPGPTWAGGRQLVVLDGVEGKEYEAIAATKVTFSPDSARLAYMAGPRGKVSVVVDGAEGTPHESLASLLFSPASKRMAYVAVRGWRLHGHLGGSLQLTEGGRWCLVIDGVPGREYDQISQVTFSPDSKHVAYAAERVQKRFLVLKRCQRLLVVDGVEGKAYDGVGEGTLAFSPDGKRLACWAGRGNKWLVLVDGVKGNAYEGFLRGSKLVFDGTTRLYGLAIRENEILRIELEIVESPSR